MHIPVMIVEASYAKTAHTEAVCPSNTVDSPHLPTSQTRASVSQLPLITNLPSGLASRAHTFEPWPMSRASALSSRLLLGWRTSMIWSFPLDTIRPSGNSVEGGTMASELMNSLPWVLIVQSYAGGLDDCRAHNRTVKSLDADTTVFGWGKATLRTWEESA